MKLLKTLLVIITFLTFGFSQSQIKPTVKTSEIKAFKIEKGIHNVSLKLTDNTIWNINISIPEIAKGETYPLVLALHWAGANTTYQDYSACLALPAANTLNAIVVSPSSHGRHWVDPLLEYRVIDLIKKIKKHWPIHKGKIIVTGYCNGAIGSW